MGMAKDKGKSQKEKGKDSTQRIQRSTETGKEVEELKEAEEVEEAEGAEEDLTQRTGRNTEGHREASRWEQSRRGRRRSAHRTTAEADRDALTTEG